MSRWACQPGAATDTPPPARLSEQPRGEEGSRRSNRSDTRVPRRCCVCVGGATAALAGRSVRPARVSGGLSGGALTPRSPPACLCSCQLPKGDAFRFTKHLFNRQTFYCCRNYENSLIQHQNVEQRMVEVMLLAHRKFSINTEPGADLLIYYVYKPSFS